MYSYANIWCVPILKYPDADIWFMYYNANIWCIPIIKYSDADICIMPIIKYSDANTWYMYLNADIWCMLIIKYSNTTIWFLYCTNTTTLRQMLRFTEKSISSPLHDQNLSVTGKKSLHEAKNR